MDRTGGGPIHRARGSSRWRPAPGPIQTARASSRRRPAPGPIGSAGGRALAVIAALAAGCRSEHQPSPPPPTTSAEPPRHAEPFAAARDRMVDETIAGRGIKDPRVIAAIRRVARHELVPAELRSRAYEDNPLPIGFDQTISQPYIVAAMTEAAELAAGERVLEVGTGSGYQAAVLAELGGVDVYSIEIVEPLATRTHDLLGKLGYTGPHLHLRIGDGYRGWPEAAPFDAIIVTAAPDDVPQPLIDQLAIGGRLVIPIGTDGAQELKVIVRGASGTTTETLFPVRFVPMTGEVRGDR